MSVSASDCSLEATSKSGQITNGTMIENEIENENSNIETNRIKTLCESEKGKDHPLWHEIDRTTSNQLYYAQLPLNVAGWQLFVENGPMKMYTKELEVDGLICDPLKAIHVVKGVTGFEMCHRFFHPSFRNEWELTLERMHVLEEINENTLIFHQIHRRVWPAAQRDAVFWSHIRCIDDTQNGRASCLGPTDVSPENDPELQLYDIWIVCNNSTDKPDIPLGNCVRLKLTVSLVCETYIRKKSLNQNMQKSNKNFENCSNGVTDDEKMSADRRESLRKNTTRDDLICKIIYSSTINPGGWVSATVLRALYKREYPRFLNTFSEYVKGATEDKSILFGPQDLSTS